MANKSNTRIQIWVHPDFNIVLKRIKAKRLLNNRSPEEISIPDLTKEMIRCKNFARLEKELTKEEIKEALKIKLDRRIR